MAKIMHDDLKGLARILPTDYADYGGTVQRWKDERLSYPDCSHGCQWFAKLGGKLGNDWGVCASRGSPRQGLLTFEHQAGFQCFVPTAATRAA